MPGYDGRSAEWWLRHSEGVAAFEKMGPDGSDFLIMALGRNENVLSQWYRRAIRKLPPQASRWLLQPSNAENQANAASQILEVSGFEQRRLSGLVTLLKHHNSRTRARAARIVSRYAQRYGKNIDLAQFQPELMRNLNDENLDTRLSIAGALNVAEIGSAEVIEALRPALTNGDLRIRRLAKMETQEATSKIGRTIP